MPRNPPPGIASAAAAVLNGQPAETVLTAPLDPRDFHFLASEVRTLAGMLGEPVPEGYRESDEEPPDSDYFEASDDIGLFP